MSINQSPTEPNTNARIAALEEQFEQLLEENSQLHDRVEDLEETVEQKDARINELEAEIARVDARSKKADANLDRVKELQGRELEKGAHLLEENVPKGDAGEGDYGVDVADGRLEKITKEDGETYLRMPESEDPVGRGGATTLAHGDLLPIQQLAQMDDDMLRSSTSDLPSELAGKLWKARVEDTGTNPWNKGSGEVREYIKSSDIRSWIFRQEGDVSDEYAKKLASRTISRLLEYSNNRLSVTKKDQRKNGLNYKERFVELRADVEIPGETSSKDGQPGTDGVLG